MLLATTSCVKAPKAVEPDTQKIDMNNVITTKEYSVPIQAGKAAVVTVNQQTVAIATEPMTILLAKGETPQVNYVEPFNNELDNSASSWQVIAFEDSRSGDYDYNDFVFHVGYETKTATGAYAAGNDRRFSFAIQPIALGSTKKITLGCDIYKGNTLLKEGVIIAEDVRSKFFASSGDKDMINTLYETKSEYCVYDYTTWYASNALYFMNSTDPIYVNWFIEVDNGQRLYALSTKRTTDMLDSENRPYGLVITNTGNIYYQGEKKVGVDWFNYPKENVSIDLVYPQFSKWIAGEITGTFSDMINNQNNDQTKCFDAIGKGLYVVNGSTDSMHKPTMKSHVIPLSKTQQELNSSSFKF